MSKQIVNRKKEIIELKKRKENNVAIKSIEDRSPKENYATGGRIESGKLLDLLYGQEWF